MLCQKYLDVAARSVNDVHRRRRLVVHHVRRNKRKLFVVNAIDSFFVVVVFESHPVVEDWERALKGVDVSAKIHVDFVLLKQWLKSLTYSVRVQTAKKQKKHCRAGPGGCRDVAMATSRLNKHTEDCRCLVLYTGAGAYSLSALRALS